MKLSKSIIAILSLSLLALVLTACNLITREQTNFEQKQEAQKCGLENCHGLEITCGQNIPDGCTAFYQLGDFCRQYAKCQNINEQCQLVKNDKFEQCHECVKNCAEDCAEKEDCLQQSQEVFECESKCAETLSISDDIEINKDIRNFDFSKIIPPSEFKFEVINQKFYKDLTFDNKEEAIFTISSGGTAGDIRFYIYTLAQNNPQKLWGGDGYKLALGFSENNELIGLCCIKNPLFKKKNGLQNLRLSVF